MATEKTLPDALVHCAECGKFQAVTAELTFTDHEVITRWVCSFPECLEENEERSSNEDYFNPN